MFTDYTDRTYLLVKKKNCIIIIWLILLNLYYVKLNFWICVWHKLKIYVFNVLEKNNN